MCAETEVARTTEVKDEMRDFMIMARQRGPGMLARYLPVSSFYIIYAGQSPLLSIAKRVKSLIHWVVGEGGMTHPRRIDTDFSIQP